MVARNNDVKCLYELDNLSLVDVKEFGVYNDTTRRWEGVISARCNSWYDADSPFYFTIDYAESGNCSDYAKVIRWLYSTLDNHPELDREPKVLHVMPDDDSQRALHFRNKETGQVSLILNLPTHYRWIEGKVYRPA